jgi:hypothetical protein
MEVSTYYPENIRRHNHNEAKDERALYRLFILFTTAISR